MPERPRGGLQEAIMFVFSDDTTLSFNGMIKARSVHLAIDGTLTQSRDEPDLWVKDISLVPGLHPVRPYTPHIGFIAGMTPDGKGIVAWDGHPVATGIPSAPPPPAQTPKAEPAEPAKRVRKK